MYVCPCMYETYLYEFSHRPQKDLRFGIRVADGYESLLSLLDTKIQFSGRAVTMLSHKS